MLSGTNELGNWRKVCRTQGDGKLPARFGFPIAVHPTDPKTVYVALEESNEYRMSVDVKFSVWRSRDAGDS